MLVYVDAGKRCPSALESFENPAEEEGLYAFARLTPPLWKKLVPLMEEARAEELHPSA